MRTGSGAAPSLLDALRRDGLGNVAGAFAYGGGVDPQGRAAAASLFNNSSAPGIGGSLLRSSKISCWRRASRSCQSKSKPVSSSKWVLADHVAKSDPMQRV